MYNYVPYSYCERTCMLKLNLQFFKHLPAREKKITIPTLFTLARIVLTPIIVAAMIFQYWGVACILFIIAALTDMIDGNLARYYGEKTFLGACLDPIADKFLLLSCFFTLAFVQSPLFAIPVWFVWLVLLKELVLIGSALLVYAIKGHIEVKPLLLGKLTAVVQMGFIIWLFACYFFRWLPIRTYYLMLCVLLIMIFASLIQYLIMGWRWFYRN